MPPDAFTETGQLWGNPLYDWTAMRADGYRWWIERFRRTFDLVDLTRIDHFRGFVVLLGGARRQQDGASTGAGGAGPGATSSARSSASSATLPVIAEDLGVITEAVERLRDELGFPGMVVLQFAFGGATRRTRIGPRTTASTLSSTPARTTTTRRSAGGRRPRRRSGRGPAPTPATRPGRCSSWRGHSPPVLALAPLQDVLGSAARRG